MSRYKAYVICTSPRSGSTLLCNMLAVTRVAGNPGSWFHEPSVSAWRRYYEMAPDSAISERSSREQIVHAAVAKGTMNRGMFGLRLQRHSFPYFCQKMGIIHPQARTDVQRIESVFGRTLFVHLTRQDKIDQAISYVKASQTGLWHAAPDGTELERLSPVAEPTYSANDIRRRVEYMTAWDKAWDDWFAAEQPDTIKITYELLEKSPIGAVSQILERLELDTSASREVQVGVAKLADEVSRDWSIRFRAEVEGSL